MSAEALSWLMMAQGIYGSTKNLDAGWRSAEDALTSENPLMPWQVAPTTTSFTHSSISKRSFCNSKGSSQDFPSMFWTSWICNFQNRGFDCRDMLRGSRELREDSKRKTSWENLVWQQSLSGRAWFLSWSSAFDTHKSAKCCRWKAETKPARESRLAWVNRIEWLHHLQVLAFMLRSKEIKFRLRQTGSSSVQLHLYMERF